MFILKMSGNARALLEHFIYYSKAKEDEMVDLMEYCQPGFSERLKELEKAYDNCRLERLEKW